MNPRKAISGCITIFLIRFLFSSELHDPRFTFLSWRTGWRRSGLLWQPQRDPLWYTKEKRLKHTSLYSRPCLVQSLKETVNSKNGKQEIPHFSSVLDCNVTCGPHTPQVVCHNSPQPKRQINIITIYVASVHNSSKWYLKIEFVPRRKYRVCVTTIAKIISFNKKQADFTSENQSGEVAVSKLLKTHLTFYGTKVFIAALQNSATSLCSE
jgi:hypothetical protein